MKNELSLFYKRSFLFYAMTTVVVALQFVFCLMGSPLLSMMDAGGWCFYVAAALSQAALFALVPYGVAQLVALVGRSGKVAAAVHIALAALLVILAFVDSGVFKLYKFHINGFVLSLLFGEGGGEIFTFGGWLYAKMAALILLVSAGSLLGYRLAALLLGRYGRIWLFPLLALLVGATLFSQLYHAYSAVKQKASVIRSATCLPYYFPLTANRLMLKLGVISSDEFLEVKFGNKESASDIVYPQRPLELDSTAAVAQNLILIALDSWNYRSFADAQTLPNIHHFADSCSRFVSHLSSSNGTRGSIFGLFFGLPSIYWRDFECSGIQPLFVEELLRQNYEVGIYPSATIVSPPFAKVLFAEVPHLRTHTEGKTVHERDCAITRDYLLALDTLSQERSRPFFSFLFYDMPHGFDLPDEKLHRFEPSWKYADYMSLDNEADPTPFWNLYRNCLAEADSLVGCVLRKLDETGLLENTVVVITGDHGQEFNENKKNYWGHGSNYSPIQTRVPFVMYWPGEAPRTYTHRTTHYDFVPTMMSRLLGVVNPPSDYSMGHCLTDSCSRNWHVVGDYLNNAFIIDEHRIIEKHPSGFVEVCDSLLNPIPGYKINAKQLNDAMMSINRFYK